MRVTLDYGTDGLPVELPDRNVCAVLGLAPQVPLADPVAAVRDALAAPIGAPPLAVLARGKRSACVAISDLTRPVPNRLLLPPILATLEASGVPRGAICILVATGTHRGNTRDELAAMVGAEVLRDYRVENHDARDRAAHVDLGTTPRGVPMLVDRRFVEAELRLSAALVEPHFMAGFSGGRKQVCPGLCALETVRVWHGPDFIGHPHADTGVLAGNPLHEDALLVARAAGLDFIVDVTLDADRRVTGVFAGDFAAAWLTAVRSVERVVEARLPAPADVVVTSAAGHPLDLTYYQVVKGMVGALPAVKAGGTIVIAARCAEGIGGAEFTRTLLESDDLDAFVARTRASDFFVPDQWEVHELAKVLAKAEVLCFTEGIPPATLARCFVTPIASVEAGVRQALARHGADARIAVIPKGPYVIPVAGAAAAATR